VIALAESTYDSSVVDLGSHAETRFAAGASPLAWRNEAGMYAWNASTHRIEEHGTDAPAALAARLSDDPANATRYHELLIVAMRGADGRFVDAIVPAEATPRWSVKPLAFVRCAGELEEPCIAGNMLPGGAVELRRIDPNTGALGAPLGIQGDIEDAAIDRGGAQLAWVNHFSEVHVRRFDGSGDGDVVHTLAGAHSLAFEPSGDLLVARRVGTERGIARVHAGSAEQVVASDSQILSLVRPSPDGKWLFFRGRNLNFELVQYDASR
jgi:hypothetical protein